MSTRHIDILQTSETNKQQSDANEAVHELYSSCTHERQVFSYIWTSATHVNKKGCQTMYDNFPSSQPTANRSPLIPKWSSLQLGTSSVVPAHVTTEQYYKSTNYTLLSLSAFSHLSPNVRRLLGHVRADRNHYSWTPNTKLVR